MIGIETLADAWTSFFHSREPATTIALFRILFGCLLVANVLFYVRHARLWIGPAGVLPHEHYLRLFGRSRLTLLGYLPPSELWVRVILAAHLVAAVSLTAGLHTRWSATVAFITMVSIQHRNPLVVYGGDDVLRVMCFLLIFSRAGESLSLDTWWAAQTGQPLQAATSWATRLMQLQVSIIYFKAFRAKLAGRTWLDGTAAYYAIAVSDFRRAAPEFSRSLWTSRVATYGTLLVEFAMGPLVWISELRYPLIALAALFHIALELVMNLHLFGATMLVCLILFVDPLDAAQFLMWVGLQ